MNHTIDNERLSEKQGVKERLLDTAEALFATQGIAATSLREITRAAEANLASVHYYFGSKEALVEAVIVRRIGPLNQRRVALLEQARKEQQGRPVPLEKLLDAFVLPTIELLTQHPQFMRVIGRLISDPDRELKRLFFSQFRVVWEPFRAALRQSLPGLPEEELTWRMHFVVGAMAHTWTNRADADEFVTGRPTAGDAGEIAHRLIEFCTAGLRAPFWRRSTP